MAKTINPFIITGKISPQYFCGREYESSQLIRLITNGNNVVIISPRRMGKTGLIQFCYDQPKIRNEYYTFFIDILHTSSLREFTYFLGKEIYEKLYLHSHKMAMLFIRTIKSVNSLKISFNSSNYPVFDIQLGDIEQPEYTLQEIFQCLARIDKPCIIAFNEFQQITKYPETKIEALLRTHIQQLVHCRFIFAGSEYRSMQEIFLSPIRPFYHSTAMLNLRAIPADVYIPFIVEQFKQQNRTITADNAVKVYTLFQGYTYYIQKTFNESFAYTPEGTECTLEILRAAIDTIITSNDTIFREILSNIPEKQKELLYAIAEEGEAEHITSAKFIKRHSLTSASSVQSAVKKLLEKNLITEVNRVFSITDKVFAMWINKLCGNNNVSINL